RRRHEWTIAPRTPFASIERANRRSSFKSGLGRYFTGLLYPSSLTHAFTTPGISYGEASPAAARSAKKLFTVEELVKVTASGSGFPSANNSRSCSIESLGITVR